MLILKERLFAYLMEGGRIIDKSLSKGLNVYQSYNEI